ncbi:MAG: glycogen synthase [Planctomycetota bacterium]|nr:MAG: glycogen synthase [Planctomycetota bacterium]
MSPLRLLFVASEVAPLAKTGGLADVVAALGAQLSEFGHDVRVLMPLYRRVRESGVELTAVESCQAIPVQLGPRQGQVSVFASTIKETGLEVWLVDCPELYDRDGIYTQDDDEHLRFAVLARAALSVCQHTSWSPDIVHAHDWHAGLLPLYVKQLASWDDLFKRTKTLLTIHNIGYQGIIEASKINDLGLDDAAHMLHQEDLADGRINFLKTGVMYADAVTTVSETYAREVLSDEHGMGLQTALRERGDAVHGIVNGIDDQEWSPELDRYIPQHYSKKTVADKVINRVALLESLGLKPAPHGPVFGIVSRLAWQKGFELLPGPLADMLGSHDVRLAVLGSGEEKYEKAFTELQQRFPGKVCFYNGYSNKLAHLIEAGSDVFLMPSRYEPCGLNQMYSLAYGTIPVVRRTGGLADTVQLFDRGSGKGTGVVFDHFDEEALRRALVYVLELWSDRAAWKQLMSNAMSQDFSWTKQARLYETLYARLCGCGGAAGANGASDGSSDGTSEAEEEACT